jgi:endonuclease YncB( thermonuclease family)
MQFRTAPPPRWARFKRWVRSIMALALLAGLLVLAWSFQTRDRTVVQLPQSAAFAIDGDSLRAGQGKDAMVIRLEGIDAPEYRQICKAADGNVWPCGRVAHHALAVLLAEGGLSCSFEGYEDSYRRKLGQCKTRLTPDIAAVMVRNGHAVSGTAAEGDRWDDGGRYMLEQAQAEKEARGIWQGTFDRPADWRKANPR